MRIINNLDSFHVSLVSSYQQHVNSSFSHLSNKIHRSNQNISLQYKKNSIVLTQTSNTPKMFSNKNFTVESLAKEQKPERSINNLLLSQTNFTKEESPNPVRNFNKVHNTPNLPSSYSKLHELKLINIGLASSQRIKQWAEKTLPNGKIIGQVTNANTLHHKTLKPQKGGLFCERIFGPLKDFECACGKNQKPSDDKQQKIFEHKELDRVFCPKCDVEYTWSVIRRYQLGYIQLVSPVTHAWYLKATPSYLSVLLDMKKRHLEYIIYSSETMTLEYSQKLTEQQYNSPSNLFKIWQKSIENGDKNNLTFDQQKSTSLKNLEKRHDFEFKVKTIKVKRFTGWRKLVFNLNNQTDVKLNNNFINNFDKYYHSNKNYKSKKLKQLPILFYIVKKIKNSSIKKSVKFLNHELFSAFYINIYRLAYEKVNQYLEKNNHKINLIINEEIKTTQSFIKTIRQLYPFSVKLNEKFQKQRLQKILFYKKFLYNILTKTKFFRNKNLSLLPSSDFRPTNLMNNTKFTNKFFSFLKFQLTIIIAKLIKYNFAFFFLTTFNYNSQSSNNRSTSHLSNKNSFNLNVFNFGRFDQFLLNKTISKYQSTLYSLSINNVAFLLSQDFINLLLKKMKNVLNRESYKIFHLIIKNKLRKTNLESKQAEFNQSTEFKSVLSNSKNSSQINGKTISLTAALDLQKLKLISQEFRTHKIIFINNLIFRNEKLDSQNLQNVSNYFLFGTKINQELKSFHPVNQNAITNNIYCLSHRYRWTTEKDWKQFIDYLGTVPELNDQPIPTYKHRIKNSQNLINETGITGTLLIQNLLEDFNFTELKKIDKQNRILLYELNKDIIRLKKSLKQTYADRHKKKVFKELYKKRDALIRRTKLIRKLFRKDSSPASMILSILPVLPPDLRPIIKVGGQIAASDLNRLYQRVIYRNERLKKFLKDPATINSYEMKYAQRLLQEAVDNLIQNGNSGLTAEKDSTENFLINPLFTS